MSNFYAGEQLGIDIIPKSITGMSWRAQLCEKIFSETGDKKLKSEWGEHNWNVGIIDKLVSATAKSLLPGADKSLALKASTGVSLASAQSFLNHIDTYRNKESTSSFISNTEKLAEKLAEGTGSAIKGAGDTIGTLPIVLTVLAVGVGSYLLFAGRRGVNLIPRL